MNITIKNQLLTATINFKGAELVSIKNHLKREFIWSGNPEFWGKHSPILFPIVGTLKNDTYQYKKKSFHMSRHGFARDMNFEKISATENSVVFSLLSNSETKNQYPFDFELQICYTLIDNQLITAYTIFNKDNNTMPFSIGAHPAFSLPENFENYAVLFDKDASLNYFLLEDNLLTHTSNKLALTNNKLPLTYDLFENDALVIKKLKSKKITIIENTIPILRIHFKDFQNLGIWTKVNAKFLCIEPWLGFSDSFNTSGEIMKKEGIQLIEPKKVRNCFYKIEIL